MSIKNIGALLWIVVFQLAGFLFFSVINLIAGRSTSQKYASYS